MSGGSEDQTTIIYEILIRIVSYRIHFCSIVLSSLDGSRKKFFSVVFMCSPAVNSLDIAPKFSIVIIVFIVDLEISLYLQRKLRFIVRREDGSAIGCRNHVCFNHDETM